MATQTVVRPAWDEAIRMITRDPYCPTCGIKIMTREELQGCWRAGHLDGSWRDGEFVFVGSPVKEKAPVNPTSTMVYIERKAIRVALAIWAIMIIVSYFAGYILRGLIR